MDKRLIAGLSMSICAVAYGITSLNKPSQITISQYKQPSQYQTLVEDTADEYLKLAQARVSQPTSQCYQLAVVECLDILTPSQPQLINSRQPEKAIALQAKLVSFQVRLDAIALAKVKASQVITLPELSI